MTITEPFTWLTAQADRDEHAVGDDAHVAGMTTGHGVYEALCGTTFLPASMDVGPLVRCRRCVAILHARSQLRNMNQRMAVRRVPWLARLRCRRASPRHAAGESR